MNDKMQRKRTPQYCARNTMSIDSLKLRTHNTQTTGFYSLEKAKAIVSAVSADDDWTYTVVDCKNGYGRIDAYDEDGELVVKGFML